MTFTKRKETKMTLTAAVLPLRRILDLLENGGLSTEEIASTLELDYSAAFRFCRILERSELVERDLRFLANGDGVAVWAVA